MSEYNPISSSPSKKPKTKVVTLIVAIVLVVVALASYSYLAYTKGWWPFTESTSKQQTVQTEKSTTPESLTISKLEVTGSGESKVLQVGLKLEDKDKGYCVLELSNKQAYLKIDDNENRKNNKEAVDFEDCLGWSVGVSQMPAGEYTAKVTFKGSDGDITASKQVTLK